MVSKTFSRSFSHFVDNSASITFKSLQPPLIRHSVRRFRDMPLDRPAWDDPRTYTSERPIGSNHVELTTKHLTDALLCISQFEITVLTRVIW